MNPKIALFGVTALTVACTNNTGDSGSKNYTCSGGTAGEGSIEDVVPDWTLCDVNATSPTFDQAVSPSDLRGQVSVWYFGHST